MSQRFYVPAAPGQVAYHIYACNDQRRRPEPDDIWVEVYPVLAWRITTIDYKVPMPDWKRKEHVSPVVLDEFTNVDDELWYPMPDGRFFWPGADDQPFAANLDEAKAKALQNAQITWDAANRKDRSHA